jgi:hypothetical protein
MSEPQVIDSLVSFAEDHSDSAAGPKLVIKHSQDIPDDHISQLKRDKIDTLHTPTGDFMRVASIPVEILQKWDREGFNFEEVLASGTTGLQRVLNRLKADSLDVFITTNKRI